MKKSLMPLLSASLKISVKRFRLFSWEESWKS